MKWGREGILSVHPPVPQFPSVSLPAAAVLRKFLFSHLFPPRGVTWAGRQAPFPTPSGLRVPRGCRKPATRPGARYSLLPAPLGPAGRGWGQAQPSSVPCQEHLGIQLLSVPQSPRTGHLRPLPRAGGIKHWSWLGFPLPAVPGCSGSRAGCRLPEFGPDPTYPWLSEPLMCQKISRVQARGWDLTIHWGFRAHGSSWWFRHLPNQAPDSLGTSANPTPCGCR